MTHTPDQLAEIVRKHGAWIRGEPHGERADLRDANLTVADLRSADLRDANLSGADLRSADLSDADLRDANLTVADLRDANLSGANLSGADLTVADLRDANLSGANLSDADLSDANLSVPKIENIDAQILAAVEAAGGDSHLNMAAWHTCATTHCRAGWAIRLAGQEGRDLEKAVGPSTAGALIYAASRPAEMRVPDFLASDADALASLRADAAAADTVRA